MSDEEQCGSKRHHSAAALNKQILRALHHILAYFGAETFTGQ